MSNFLYLFRGGDDDLKKNWSQQDREAHMLVWQKWMGELAQEGKLVDGLPLAQEGKVVEKGGEVVTDGPFAEGAELVGGYLIVAANDIKEATEISKGCPIFDYSGTTLEIREILSMDM